MIFGRNNLFLTNILYFCDLLNQLIIIDMKKNLRNIGFILALGAMTMTSCSEATEAANTAKDTAVDAAHGAADKAAEVAGDAVEAVAGDHKCEEGKCGDAMEKATDAAEEVHEEAKAEHGAH